MKIKSSGLILLLWLFAACTPQAEPLVLPGREDRIPSTAQKQSPVTDLHPPLSLSEDYEQPVPLPAPVNTRGLEDSPFIMPDGHTLYFFFTPDPAQDAAAQSTDLVTGIYVTHHTNDTWSEPQRVWLIEPGKPVLDGCAFATPQTLWFCSVREGYEGIHWFSAQAVDGTWSDWQVNDFDPAYDVGEFHIYGDQLYYHSDRAGGMGGLDIWMLTRTAGGWSDPVNVTAVNTDRDEGWPAVSPNGSELWISRDYGLWRSRWLGDAWSEPELIISPLAGEAALDAAGNLYFTHHFFDGSGTRMLEADLYVAYRK